MYQRLTPCQDVFGKEKIVSLYLAQQGSHQDTREKYRSYLENSETMRATRRKQLFKQNNYPTEVSVAMETYIVAMETYIIS